MSILLELKPELLWKNFDDIRKIPRCSKHEENIREFIRNFATDRKLEFSEDGLGNIVITKPGKKGFEGAPITILQGHMDMVCEKDKATVHDFDKDPIEVEMDGDYITAKGTSLGSDNGIGIATALAVLESDELVHGPLECLFTIDEETGLTGAFQLKPEFLAGRIMLNLDSEEEGSIYVGCAGGSETSITMPVELEDVAGDNTVLKLTITGLRGGHSGVDIHEQRGNAIKLFGRTLNAMIINNRFKIAKVEGGSKRNAIPREANVTVVMDTSIKSQFIDDLKSYEKALKEEYKPVEKEFRIEIDEDAGDIDQVLTVDSTGRLLNLIEGLPDGVLAMNLSIPDLVETSTNLATIGLQDSTITIGMLSRSSADSSMKAVEQRLAAVARLADATAEHSNFYPGWKANLDSNVLKIAQAVHTELFNKEPEVKAIHAGLETGIIGVKFPGMDMISIGPTIENPHSPDERVGISSVESFWKFVSAILNRIAQNE